MWAKILLLLAFASLGLAYYGGADYLNGPTCNPPPKQCPDSKYRSIDGSCNNLANQYWGSAGSVYQRLVGYNFADGKHQIATSSSGAPLPNARLVSYKLFPPKNVIEKERSLLHMQFGQLVAHDQSFSTGASEIIKNAPPVNCCSNGELGPDASNTDRCAPILIEKEDPVYAPAGIKCLNYERAGTTADKGCRSGDQEARAINSVTSFLDLSIVYGSNDDVAKSIRAKHGGRFKIAHYKGEDFPPQVDNVTKTCPAAKSQTEPCYKGGDERMNQNPQFTSLHVLWLREHNRIADALHKLNPHWDDEQIYKEARRIVIALYQHIIYNEYLPLLIGKDLMVEFKLQSTNKPECVNDYDPNANPNVLDEHTTGGAYRYFHSAISGCIHTMNQKRQLLQTIRLSDWFNRPLSLEKNGTLNFDTLCTGMTTQHEDGVDRYFDEEITLNLFRNEKELGQDLRAIDIQHARDHGMGTYVQLREFCGLKRPQHFDDMSAATGIPKEDVDILKSFYEKVEDVDLLVGGSIEPHVPGTQAGETFLCIMYNHFSRSRFGDRYFYENCEKGAFTKEQLNEIRKVTFSRIFCDNVKTTKYMQPQAFVPIGDQNKLKPCTAIPSMCLQPWLEMKK